MSLISYSPLVTSIHGKTGTNIFKVIHSNPLLQKAYQRLTKMNNFSTFQRATFVNVTKSWKLLLDSQRLAWSNLAVQVNAGSIKFFGTAVSGYSLYVSCNLNLNQWNNTTISDAPAFDSIHFPVTASATVNLINADFPAFFTWSDAETWQIEVKCSPPVSPGVSLQNCFRYLINSSISSTNVINLNPAYTNLFPGIPSNFFKIFFEFRFCNFANGFASPWRKFFAVKNVQFVDFIMWDTSIDSNLTASITTDSSSIDIDWGDGTVDIGLSGILTHTYATSGIYMIKFRNVVDLNNIILNSADVTQLYNLNLFPSLSNLSVTLSSINSLSLPALHSCSIEITKGSLILVAFSAFDFSLLDVSNNQLSSGVVNNIINAALVSGLSGRTLILNGQTPPAPPTGDAFLYVSILRGRGWTVNTD